MTTTTTRKGTTNSIRTGKTRETKKSAASIRVDVDTTFVENTRYPIALKNLTGDERKDQNDSLVHALVVLPQEYILRVVVVSVGV
jgi:hypothetical protein